MKMLRLTRHAAGEAQVASAKRIWGADLEIDQVSETLPADGREAVARFDSLAGGYDVVEAVLPINLIEAVLKFSEFAKNGGTVVRAITERIQHDAETVTFEFAYYERILKVETVTERL